MDVALRAQNRRLPHKRPEKLYTTYLEKRHKLFYGDPEWAKLEKKKVDDTDDLDNDILKVFSNSGRIIFMFYELYFIIFCSAFSIVVTWKHQRQKVCRKISSTSKYLRL